LSNYLWHITLETGHSRRSLRTEVSDEIILMLRPHLEGALRRGTVPLPIEGGYQLKATAAGAFLVGTILDRDDTPIVTFGVAPRSRGAAKLWAMLHDGRPTDTEAPQPPAAPWLAVRMEFGALDFPDALDWLADYERCIAWTWIEMRKDAHE